MNRYSVVLVSPPGYAHSPALLDVARLLVHSFETLGLTCRMVVNTLDRDAVNIVLGYHLLPDPSVLAPHRVIIYQLEQLSEREGWFNPTRSAILHEADEVWDYSPANVAFLAARGVDVRLLPLGYHEELGTIADIEEPEIDVLFYGSINDRRKAILEALAPHCRLQTLFGAYGEMRDDQIAQAKIVLNVHFYERQIMEQVRVSYLLNNRRFVLSEKSVDNPYEDALATASLPDIIDVCRYYLDHPCERDRMAETGHDFLEQRPMADYLRAVLSPQSGTVVSYRTPSGTGTGTGTIVP